MVGDGDRKKRVGGGAVGQAMRILLATPPFRLSKDSPYSKTGARLPPLGLLYLAGWIRRELRGHEIAVLDCAAENLSVEEFCRKAEEFRPDVLGMTVYSTTFSAVVEACRSIRRALPLCRLVAGGPHASVLPEECLEYGMDIAVLGEGEIPFARLIAAMEGQDALESIPNLVYRGEDGIQRTSREAAEVPMEELVFPARDLVNMKVYRPAFGTFRRSPATNMITSRGCPFHCCFCSKSIFGKKYRTMSAGRIVEEIEFLQKEYGIREVLFNDDVFTLDTRRTEEFCELVMRKKLDITWSCSTRVNLVSEGLLQKMARSGCVAVGYGIESGDPEFLKKISKGIELDLAERAIRWTRKAGIESRAFYIFGLPGETRKSMEKTLETALQFNSDYVIFNLAIPMPGTELYEQAKRENLLFHDGMELYKRTDGPHPLIRLPDMTSEELAAFYQRAYRRYYLRPGYIWRRISQIRSPGDIQRNAAGFLSFLGWVNPLGGT